MIRILLRLIPDESRQLRRRYVALLAGVVVTRAAACVLLFPVLSRLFSDSPGDAWGWIAAFVVAVVVHGVLQHRLARTGFALGLEVMDGVQHRLVDHIAQLPLGWLSGARRSMAQQAIAATGPQVAQTIGNLVTPLVLAVALPTAIAVGLLAVAWPLGLAALAAVPLLLAALAGANRSSRKADTTFAAAVTDLDARILEFGRAQTTLRAARRADPDRSLAGEALASQHLATVGLLRWSIPGQLLFSVASQLALLALAIAALALLHRGDVSVPEALALIVIAVRFLEPFTTLAELAPALQATTTALRSIDDVLHAPTLVGVGVGDANGGADVTVAPEVRLDAVRFRHAGATTATIDGRVLVAGADVRTVAPDDLYARLSIVFQDVYLFDGTIRDNVLVGCPDADEQELAAAAALARVDEIVERLAAGWDTPVGEGGVALSGGERQRVGIARALLKRAPLLLVDEATSSLDNENEQAIAAALVAAHGARTTIVVAHRMQTIEQADHVVFVDAGRVVEAGSREELLDRDGRFATFHRDQVASRTWTIGRGGAT